MIFEPLPIDGAFVVRLEPHTDERGFFARAFCEFAAKDQNLNPHVSQANLSHTKRKGTIRGLHYQLAPHEEAKLIRCIRGGIFDVVADRRPGSKTYGKWAGVELTAENHDAVYVPEGCAHGFQTLTDDVEVFYLVSHRYVKESDTGIRYSDPTFAIQWPLPVSDLSEKDAALPFLV